MNRNGVILAGLIGHGIGGSLTPALHEAEGKAHGIDYRYHPVDTALSAIAAQSLSQRVTEAEGKGYAGLNITHPHKVEVCSLMDHISPQAKRVGAVNTIQFRNGERIGHNTDVTGFASAFRADMADVAKDRVLMLGAGGAGAAVAEALMMSGVRNLMIYDKAVPRAQDLAHRTALRYPQCKVTSSISLSDADFLVADGVVNATPIGMDGHPGIAVDPGLLDPGMWVADIVYFPLETLLLQHAKALGCRTMNGSGMAIHQAAEAFTLITGRQANAARMATCFDGLIKSRNSRPKALKE